MSNKHGYARKPQPVIGTDPKGPLLPFKGKGSARRHLHELEERHAAILEHMRQVIDELNVAFRQPRPASLALHHHGGYYHLRWRVPGESGRRAFVELCISEAGRHVLDALSPAVRDAVLSFERRRLALNLASSLCRHEQRRLREYTEKLDALEACERQYGD